MSESMFVALMNTIALLGMKERPSKDEAVAYNHLLAYAGSVARINTLLIGEEIERKLDATHEHPRADRPRPASRVA